MKAYTALFVLIMISTNVHAEKYVHTDFPVLNTLFPERSDARIVLTGMTSGADSAGATAQCEVAVDNSKDDGVYGIQGVVGKFNQVGIHSDSPEGIQTGYTRFDSSQYEVISNSSNFLHTISDPGASPGCKPETCFFTYKGKKITNLKTELLVNSGEGLNAEQAASKGKLQFAFVDGGTGRLVECNINSIRLTVK